MVFIYNQIDFEGKSRIFDDSLEIISTNRLSEIPACFERMEQARKSGYFLAGFLSYEAGNHFVEKQHQKEHYDFPLVCFGVYPKVKIVRKRNKKALFRGVAGSETNFNLDYAAYKNKIDSIRALIAEGETYQITFCVKSRFFHRFSPKQIFNHLQNYQPVPYPALIRHPDFKIMSLSPEMFLKIQRNRKNERVITTKPMKGTLFRDNERAYWPKGAIKDLFDAAWLHNDPKNRAENIMITDLLRNDLGKICKTGSVETKKMYEVAKYRTVFQMTSTVEGVLADNQTTNSAEVSLYEIFKAIFPSGSVTGAPKQRSMQIIQSLEEEERRIYTGAIGFVAPKGQEREVGAEVFFNVPIRTILVRNNQAEMGVGGGITYYSTPEGEWNECQVKARFLEN